MRDDDDILTDDLEESEDPGYTQEPEEEDRYEEMRENLALANAGEDDVPEEPFTETEAVRGPGMRGAASIASPVPPIPAHFLTTMKAPRRQSGIPPIPDSFEEERREEIPAEGESIIPVRRQGEDKPRYDLGLLTNFGALYDGDYRQRDCIKPGFLRGMVGSRIGTGGTGKSFVTIEESVAIAIGRNLLEKGYVRRGGVLFIPAEDSTDEIGERIQSIAKAWKMTDEEMKMARRNFLIWPLMGWSPDILEKDEDGSCPLIKAIVRIVQKARLYGDDEMRLIIFDTLRRFSFADENSGGEMARVLAQMEYLCLNLNVSCLFLHHSTKSATMSGDTSQCAARGSSVLSDNIRYQEQLNVMSEEESEKYGEKRKGERPFPIGADRKLYVKWCVSKQTSGYQRPDMWLKRDKNGVLLPVEIELVDKKGGGRH